MVPLSHEEINKYTDGKAIRKSSTEYSESNREYAYGNMSYYSSESCYGCRMCRPVYYGCTNDYKLSNVKKVVDAWTQDNFNSEDIISLEEEYLSRLIKVSEIAQFDSQYDGTSILPNPNDIPNWILKLNNYGWTMDGNGREYKYTIESDYLYSSLVHYEGSVRPTIKLKKNSISKVSFNEYHNNAIREYKIGDIINYNDTRFYVIKNSSENDSTVTLLKDSPLTKYQLETYGEGYINNYTNFYNWKNVTPGEIIYDDGLYKVAYLSTDKCSNLTSDFSGCNQNYDVSNVKHIVDNWLLENISVDDIALDEFNYNVRLINDEDLVELGYINIQANTTEKEYFKAGNDTPSFMLGDNTKGMLTMIPSYIYTGNSYNDYGITVADNGYRFMTASIPNYSIGTVRPVVTLNKKEIAPKITNVEEIEDTVSEDDQSNNIEVDIETEVDNSNVNEYAAKEVTNVISVPNTLSSKNMLLIIIGGIISGVGIITFIYFKKK